MALKVGDIFRNPDEFMEKLKEYSEKTSSQFYIRDSKKVEAAGKSIKRFLNPDIKVYQLHCCCIKGGKHFKSQSTGKRNKKTIHTGCKAHIRLCATADGCALRILSMSTEHNHNPAVVRPTTKLSTCPQKSDMTKFEHNDKPAMARPTNKLSLCLQKKNDMTKFAVVENENHISFEVSRICRLCSRNEGPMQSIFEKESRTVGELSLEDKILYCTSVKVSESEEFPSLVCETCVKLLEIFYFFKKRCIDIHIKLLESVNTGLHKSSNSKKVASQATPSRPVSNQSANVPLNIQKCRPTSPVVLPTRLEEHDNGNRPVLLNSLKLKSGPPKHINPSSNTLIWQIVNDHRPTIDATTKTCVRADASAGQISNLSNFETLQGCVAYKNEMETNPLDLVSCSYENDFVNVLESEIPYVSQYETIDDTESDGSFENMDTPEELEPNSSRNTKIDEKCNNCLATMEFCERRKRQVCTICLGKNNTKVFASKCIFSKKIKDQSKMIKLCHLCNSTFNNIQSLAFHIKFTHY